MPFVKCKYREEEWEEDGPCAPTEKYIAGEYKRVEWDGALLKIGTRKIRSSLWYAKEIERTGQGYWGGGNDILYLEIDGTVYIEEKQKGRF